MTLTITPKPTRSETSFDQRQAMVRRAAAGETAAEIATALGVSVWTVGRWVRAFRRDGEAALRPKSRRPHTRHPQTTPQPIVDRIQSIRTAHPGWGARLIRNQLLLEGVESVPSETTVQAWLRRLGFDLVRPPTGKPLGWHQEVPAPTKPTWQADHKLKGGSGC